MTYDTLAVFTSTYTTVDDAVHDFEAVKNLYHDSKLVDTFDAVVIEKRPDGKVKIVKRYEKPTRDGAKIGAGIGLATGLALALFPGAAIGAGIIAARVGVGAVSGAVLGALAGHVTGGISRGDLKELGETLDTGTGGLVVIAASNIEEKLRNVLKKGVKTIRKQLKTDAKALEKELEHAEKEETALAKR